MPSASPFLATQEPALSSRNSDLWDIAEICLQRTAEALHQVRAATVAEISQAMATVREEHARERPSELLEVLAHTQANGEGRMGSILMELGNKVAGTMESNAPCVPFAGKLIAPSAFYESFDQIHKLARILLSPVIYAEDTDSIGTASVNAIASTLLAEEIRNAAHKRFGIRPFVTVARLDYESWTFLTHKHFEL
jgi:hypothetical protein